MDVLRDKPSTRARERSYVALRSLMYLLNELGISNHFYTVDHHDRHVGWKNWVIKYTPPNKRGWTGNPKIDNAIKRKNNI